MRNAFFTLTFLLIASILIYSCGNETNNPALTDGFNADSLAFASPRLQGNVEGRHGMHQEDNDVHHFDDDDDQHLGTFMNGQPMDISIEKVEVEGEVVEVLPSGNFTLQTEAEEIFVMLRHHSDPNSREFGYQPASRHHGMRRRQNARSRGDIKGVEGVEAGAKVAVTGFLMTRNVQDDEERIVNNRLLATEISKDGETIYVAEDDEFWHGMGDFDDMPMNISVEKTEVSGKVTEVFPVGNFTLQTEAEEIFVMLRHHRDPNSREFGYQSFFRRYGMRRWQNARNRRNIGGVEGIEVSAEVTVTGFLMTHDVQDDEERMVNNRLLATEISKDGEIIYTAEGDDFWHCIIEQKV